MTQSDQPNEFNGLTRYDTHNIRPDLFQALKDGVHDYRAVVLGYVEESRTALAETEGHLVESRRLTEESKTALAESRTALAESRTALNGAVSAAGRAEVARGSAEFHASEANGSLVNIRLYAEQVASHAGQAESFSQAASNSLSLSKAETSKAGEYSHQAFLHLQGATEQNQQATAANTSAIDAMNKANAARDSAIGANTSAIGALKEAQDIQADVSAKHQTVLEKHDAAISAAQAAIDANNQADTARDEAIEANRQATAMLADAQEITIRQTAAEIENVRALVDSLRESQQAMLQAQHETLSISQVRTNSTSEFFNYEYFHNPFHFTSRFTAKGSWRGKVNYQYTKISSNVQQIFLGEWQVPDSNGSRVKEFDMGTNAYDWFYLQFEVENGVQKTRDITQGHIDTPQNSWYRHTNQTFTTKTTGAHAVYWEVMWDATTYHNQYAIRVTTSKNRTLGQWGPHTKVGPLLPGFDGSRTHYLRLADQQLQAGEQVFFETFTDATEPSQRAVRATMTKISWIEES